VLQAKQQNQPTKIRNEKEQTMPVLIQMLKLPWDHQADSNVCSFW